MTSILAASFIAGLTRVLTGVRGIWAGFEPMPGTARVYFANHRSHGDAVVMWAVLARRLGWKLRPVGAADYWTRGRIRRFFVEKVFRSILVDRGTVCGGRNPIPALANAIENGDSLIVFPEGTRNTTKDQLLLPFKCGLYHLARARPSLEFVPVWISNFDRVLPKGELLPVPFLCTVTFGSPLRLSNGESKRDFMIRTFEGLASLAPLSPRKAP
jgi:1-acyl-sn-glycerol-3-phosphate acyltransferase